MANRNEEHPLPLVKYFARGGYYGTIDDVEQSLEKFLTPYAELLAVQCPHLVPDMQ
jgi:hypothetical protein